MCTQFVYWITLPCVCVCKLQDTVHDEFTRKLKEKVSELIVGNGLDSATTQVLRVIVLIWIGICYYDIWLLGQQPVLVVILYYLMCLLYTTLQPCMHRSRVLDIRTLVQIA